ncbi:MAG: hypothetical protein PQJ46_14960 [Spirochaetales bacterium]|nr:hypothetical protein [Spirochaetales bacterium]
MVKRFLYVMLFITLVSFNLFSQSVDIGTFDTTISTGGKVDIYYEIVNKSNDTLYFIDPTVGNLTNGIEYTEKSGKKLKWISNLQPLLIFIRNFSDFILLKPNEKVIFKQTIILEDGPKKINGKTYTGMFFKLINSNSDTDSDSDDPEYIWVRDLNEVYIRFKYILSEVDKESIRRLDLKNIFTKTIESEPIKLVLFTE